MNIDFQKLISDLQGHGWTQQEISEEVGLPQGVISRLKNTPGSEPRYNVGARLVALRKRARNE